MNDLELSWERGDAATSTTTITALLKALGLFAGTEHIEAEEFVAELAESIRDRLRLVLEEEAERREGGRYVYSAAERRAISSAAEAVAGSAC